MKQKTLLLVFIHGFQGGDDTFARFPPHLRALLTHALPQLKVVQVQYPKFETRGDLGECVSRFREWLQNKVIDLEVDNGTPSPTVDPSVRTILLGHSMGGIVAAETILSIIREQPIPHHSPSSSTTADGAPSSPTAFMFPSILGLLAFDTPYLGISPGVLAHGAETHYQTASAAWNAYNSVTNVFGYGNTSKAPADAAKTVNAAKALPAPSASDADVAAVPAWQRWGRYAMYAGAAGAVVAGGAAAYANRAQLSEGWSWATSHLEFVGCLARGQELQSRVSEITSLTKTRGLGFANVYTQLGSGAGTLSFKTDGKEAGGQGQSVPAGEGGWAQTVVGSQRTFCLLPKSEVKQFFEPTVNEKAENEIGAHMNMFTPRDNPGYYGMSERAKELLVKWVKHGWVLDEVQSYDGAVDDEDVEIVDREEAKETGESGKASS